MRYFYSILYYLFIPLVLLRLVWRARYNKAYLQRWPERFGFANQAIPEQSIWIHAISVGEVLAAIPLIKQLRHTYPQLPLLVTTTTITGSTRVQESLKLPELYHVYCPYDLPDAVGRFLKNYRPRLLVLIETELWPNLMHACYQQKIPVLLANARLSERSYKLYHRYRLLTRPMVEKLDLILAQAEPDAERFIQLGIPKERVHITGSIKFDLSIPSGLKTEGKVLRSEWGALRPVWIAASTHAGEEEVVLQAFTQLRKHVPELVLILVPRHPERFEQVAVLCRQQGFNITRRSEKIAAHSQMDIFIGDTMGELLLFYAAADVAFVGGSMVTVGGHNPLEPAALGIPVITGPHTFNFATIMQQLQAIDVAVLVQDSESLAMVVLDLLRDVSKRQLLSQRAQTFVEQNRGALAKHLQWLGHYLSD